MESEFFLRDAIALHETLFQCKADPNIRNWAGDTALHAVVDNGHNKDIISLLLDHGADINAKDFNSCTALHIAASRDLIDLPDRPTPAPHVSNPGQIFVASNAKSQQRLTTSCLIEIGDTDTASGLPGTLRHIWMHWSFLSNVTLILLSVITITETPSMLLVV